MKFLKLFFSRAIPIMTAIVLQVLLIMAVNLYLKEHETFINTIFSIVAVLVFFALVTKDQPATYKLPWVIIILVFPFFGVMMYLLFGDSRLSRKYGKQFRANLHERKNQLEQSQKSLEKLKQQSISGYGQAEYIQKSAMLTIHESTNTEYLNSGEKFFLKLIEELKKAKKYIFMEYFIVEKGIMWDEIYSILKQKVKEGVEVYFLYDDVGCITRLKSRFYKKMRKDGIKCIVFNPFKPIVSIIHNNRDHRKITVVDGEKGFVGGANIADEYINIKQPFGVWKDSAIFLEGQGVDNLVKLFISMYNPFSKQKLDVKNFIVEHKVDYENGFVLPFGTGPKYLYGEYVGENIYANIINQAKKYVYITSPYLVIDTPLLNALKVAATRGVDVRIILPHIPDKKLMHILAKSNYPFLIKAGVKIYEFVPGFIHSKTFVCDDEIAVVGTINLDYRSLIHHFECGVWMYNTKSVKELYDDYNILLTKSMLISKENTKLKWHQNLVKKIMSIFTPLF
ncbi:MAG: cardiolipin synthase [Clostridia bacterium]|nr:cardiolipin synthase [Clostridia bacterium]